MSEKLTEAREFAFQLHSKQKHKGKHLDQVSDVLTRFGYHFENNKGISQTVCEQLQIAAYLHDVLEDTPIDRYTLKKLFGEEVEKLVYAVSDGNGANREEKKEIAYEKIRQAGHLALVLKLADRIANVEFSNTRSVFHMYWKERTSFRKALYSAGECEEMWAYLENLYDSQQPLAQEIL